jgi:hypothetical protein
LNSTWGMAAFGCGKERENEQRRIKDSTGCQLFFAPSRTQTRIGAVNRPFSLYVSAEGIRRVRLHRSLQLMRRHRQNHSKQALTVKQALTLHRQNHPRKIGRAL